MIIIFNGITLQVIDNGDGTFDVKPLDAVIDKKIIRDELSKLRDQRRSVAAEIDSITSERDQHGQQRDFFSSLRSDKVDERTAIVAKIDELVAFLQTAGDTNP